MEKFSEVRIMREVRALMEERDNALTALRDLAAEIVTRADMGFLRDAKGLVEAARDILRAVKAVR